MNQNKQELQNLTSIPTDIIDEVYEDIMQNTTWGRTHQPFNLSYERIEKPEIFKISEILASSLEIGDIFSFADPKTTNLIYRVKRKEDYRCLLYKIN